MSATSQPPATPVCSSPSIWRAQRSRPTPIRERTSVVGRGRWTRRIVRFTPNPARLALAATRRLNRLRTPFLTLTLLLAAAQPATADGAFATGTYRNLFREYLGKSDAEVHGRLDQVWTQLTTGDADRQRLYYPVAGGMAYVPDVANHDVRSEGLSYFMMIAVQLDHRDEFNAVWKFAKTHMQHDRGPYRGYFAWHTTFDGRRLSDGPACDGEEWFVTALFFASHRWGDGDGVFAYGKEAQALLRTMLHKHEEPGHDGVTDMFDRAASQVNFVPHGAGATFTDPSYHVPAFSELWSRWASDPADRAFLAGLAPASRALFRAAAHPRTGLMPDYSHFDGRPYRAAGEEHGDFRYDAWRTLSNPALDHSWWAADPWQIEQSNRVLRFLAAQPGGFADCYAIDGTPRSKNVNSAGLLAMAATAALVADRELGEPFVRRLWAEPLPEGKYRYYSGLLTVLALLEVSGNFRIYAPPVGR